MLPHSIISSTSYSPRHDYRGLLFQFIMLEFISAYQETLKIKELSSTMESSKKDLDSLTRHVVKLSGSSQEQQRLWKTDPGKLFKLKSYCTLYTDAVKSEENEKILDFQNHINMAWLYCLHGLEILRTGNLSPLSRILEKIGQCMKRAARLLEQSMQSFRKDENVLFFLLRYQQEFGGLYGPLFMRKLIAKMYPKGVQDAERFVVKQYEERGFGHLSTLISEKISELSPA